MADAEDAYSATMSRTILVEKRARRLAEDDALRLYNRVRQLQKEEDKARKRIQDTKRRAREIIKLRERNEQRLAEKEARLREIEAELERQRIENLNKKEEALKARTEQENRLYAEKVTLVQQTKEEKLEIERLLAESKLLARKEALEQKEAIRRAQEEAKRKIDTVKASKLQMAQEEYERRLREEMEAKEQKEKEIEKLALLEVELIERLKLKQTQQKKAYQQLEAVLAMGVRRPSSKPSSPQVSVTALPGVASAGSAGGGGMDVVAAPIGADEEPSEEDVARAFSMYDEDGVGEISTLALDALMKDLGVPLSAQQLGQAIAQLDTQQQGKITFGEFLLWWKG